MIKNCVRLIEVRSKSKKINDVWNDLFNVKIKIDNTELDFDTDLKDGIQKEVEKIFSPQEYNYNKFETLYGRATKEQRSIYGVDYITT